jgi:sugar phosphate isomerase/epimerase
VDDGLPLLERAVQEAESVSRHFHCLSVVWLGDARRMVADLPTARRLGREALRLATERRERGNAAYALRLLGDVERAGGPREMETAREHYRRALALAEKLGMRPLVSHCHLGLGRLFQRLKERATADEHLAAAASCFRELDMLPCPVGDSRR